MRPSDPGQRVKGVHSDRRPGVCCDGVNQTYPVPLRVVDAHGLTEVIGAVWWALPTLSARGIPLFIPFTGKTVCDKGTQI